MKFQKLLMTFNRQKHLKCPQNGSFSPFFQKSDSGIFVPLWCLNFMQKLEKTNERSLRYVKADTKTDRHTEKGDY